MDKLEKAKEIIQKNWKELAHGIYNTRNWVGDQMETIYVDNDLLIDACWGNEYFEVFGLTGYEFEELKNYYNELRGYN